MADTLNFKGAWCASSAAKLRGARHSAPDRTYCCQNAHESYLFNFGIGFQRVCEVWMYVSQFPVVSILDDLIDFRVFPGQVKSLGVHQMAEGLSVCHHHKYSLNRTRSE